MNGEKSIREILKGIKNLQEAGGKLCSVGELLMKKLYTETKEKKEKEKITNLAGKIAEFLILDSMREKVIEEEKEIFNQINALSKKI